MDIPFLPVPPPALQRSSAARSAKLILLSILWGSNCVTFLWCSFFMMRVLCLRRSWDDVTCLMCARSPCGPQVG